MTDPNQTPETQVTHIKDLDQRRTDRSRLRQVALLWWSQKIYECAVKASIMTPTTKPYREDEPRYREAMSIMAGAVKELRAIQQGRSLRLNPPFAAAGMGFGLGKGQHEVQFSLGGQTPKGGNCQSDDECPEDYICDDLETCVYLFPELP